MKRWAYYIAFSPTSPVRTLSERRSHLLNKLGDQGWECFAVDEADDGRRFYFKRPEQPIDPSQAEIR